jgi:hypothetical protein
MADGFGEMLKTNITFYYTSCLGCSKKTLEKDCLNGDEKYCQITGIF